MKLRAHPQETSENAVDISHFQYVHGYDSVKQVGNVHVDGAYLRNRFVFRRRTRLAGVPSVADVAATTHVWGLGYSLVEIHERVSGLKLRQWILSTPVDDTRLKLVIALQLKRWEPGQKWLATLLLRCFSANMLTRFFIARVKHDVRQDIAIWENKRYQPLPILSRADGEFMTYRKYCEQFYPDPGEAGPSVRRFPAASPSGYSDSRAAPQGRVAVLCRGVGDPSATGSPRSCGAPRGRNCHPRGRPRGRRLSRTRSGRSVPAGNCAGGSRMDSISGARLQRARRQGCSARGRRSRP